MTGLAHGQFTDANPTLPPAIKPQQQRHHRTTRQNQLYQCIGCKNLESGDNSRRIGAPIFEDRHGFR